MKFLRIDDTVINVNNITQIFIRKESAPDFYYKIVVFYEGFNTNGHDKTKRVAYYKKDIKDYETADRLLKELLEKLNS